MAGLDNKSSAILSTCDFGIQAVINRAAETLSLKVICGHREKAAQDAAFYSIPRRSKKKYPDSPHNQVPSLAVDVTPDDVRWDILNDPTINPKEYYKQINQAYFNAGIILATGKEMGTELIFGGDWNVDYNTKDNNFDDLFHFQLRNTET